MELGEDTQKFKYILVIIDNFLKWATLRPLKTLEKEETAIILWRLFLEEGFPNTIIYDQGRTVDNHGVGRQGRTGRGDRTRPGGAKAPL